MTVHDALVWCSQQVGSALDFDGQYGAQCTDFFNFYYQHITGRNPYSDGYGVPGAKDLWDVPTDLFDKVVNNPSDPNQLPPPGSIIIWSGALQGSEGFGHVAVVDYNTDAKNVHVYDQNWGGQYVHWQYHMWTGTEIGWLVFKNFADAAPPPPPAPAPAPEPVPEPVPPAVPAPVENPPTPVDTPAPVLPDLTNNVPTPPSTDGVVTVTVNPRPPVFSTTSVSQPPIGAPRASSLTGWVWAALAATVAAFLLFVH